MFTAGAGPSGGTPTSNQWYEYQAQPQPYALRKGCFVHHDRRLSEAPFVDHHKRPPTSARHCRLSAFPAAQL
jgi:hypothetical protein